MKRGRSQAADIPRFIPVTPHSERIHNRFVNLFRINLLIANRDAESDDRMGRLPPRQFWILNAVLSRLARPPNVTNRVRSMTRYIAPAIISERIKSQRHGRSVVAAFIALRLKSINLGRV